MLKQQFILEKRAGVKLGGRFGLEVDGLTSWCHNGVTTVGLNDILNTYFRNGTPPASFFFLLIDSAGFTALSSADTMASHSGWTENTDYDEATRQAWSPPAAAGGILVNDTVVELTVNDTINVQGIGLSSDSTKGGTSGILWATGEFSVPRTIIPGKTLKLFYELQARQG